MKVKKRNYLIELNTWKKGAFVYNSKHINITLNKSMVNLYEVIIKEKAMRCRRRECLWWKIAMEVARGGNDHVYTRFKLLSYAAQPAMMLLMMIMDGVHILSSVAYKHAWNVWNFHENALQGNSSCITLWEWYLQWLLN